MFCFVCYWLGVCAFCWLCWVVVCVLLLVILDLLFACLRIVGYCRLVVGLVLFFWIWFNEVWLLVVVVVLFTCYCIRYA